MKEQVVLKNINDFENKSLLIVDDDNPFRERLARAMEKKGFEVTQAESVQKGVDSVKAKKPGFAVVDLRLGDGNGLEVVKEIQNSNNESRIIMLTGYGNIPTAVAAIKEAYFNYGVKTFSLDTKDELIKIIESTNNAKDLELFVRVAVSNEHAEIDLSKKFGALNSEAAGLLRLVKQHAKKIGLSFHVGSQCMHPISYSKGINEIGNIIKKTKILPDYINVGGGFPTIYPDLVPQSMDSYFNEIKKGLDNLKLEKLPEIICEPGRALVAESGSTIVRVNLRKKQKLYINDGTYGTLFDAGTPNIVFPSKMIKDNSNKIISKKLTAFDFFGPTCDSMDYMKGPFLLPNNIKENDYIELGQLGAYGLTFRTQFNGYYSDEIFEVEDKPIMTMYDKDINKATLVA